MEPRDRPFTSGNRLLLSVLLLCAGVLPVQSDEIYRADAVKAAFLYRFTGYVDWPQEALNRPAFTIAVLDSNAVAQELARLLPGHSVKNLPAQVRIIHSLRDAAAAQMLYVGADYSGDLHALIDALGERPVLVVTDRESGLDDGSAVNFLLVDRRLRFEISLSAAEHARLKVEPALLSVAAHVLGGPHSDLSCMPMVPLLFPDQSCLLMARS